jgi:hypothetical protein
MGGDSYENPQENQDGGIFFQSQRVSRAQDEHKYKLLFLWGGEAQESPDALFCLIAII